MRVFGGYLSGNGLTARCNVSRDDQGAYCIRDVTRPLPDGDYELLVNGLVLKATLAKAAWEKVEIRP